MNGEFARNYVVVCKHCGNKLNIEISQNDTNLGLSEVSNINIKVNVCEHCTFDALDIAHRILKERNEEKCEKSQTVMSATPKD